jgi:DNA-binding response OmpR family regulator
MTDKILIIEDEGSISRLVRLYLEPEGYDVVAAADGAAGLQRFDEERPDLVVLDLLLPRVDGLEVCRQIRRRGQTPILMLTAKRDEADKITGLELGADDYMTKPFSPREMVTRVKAILRRARMTHGSPQEALVTTVGDLSIDEARREVRVRGELVDLTNKEFEVLRLLAGSPGIVFSRDALLNQVWGFDYYGDARTVDVHIGTLRKKIEANPSSPVYVKTVWGIGYKFGGVSGA